MDNNEIFQKSDLGREEIKAQSLGVLPREARTLLILIDGKKTYQRYLDTLDNSKMFVETGGVVPLFELLQDLEYIELVEQAGIASSEQETAIPKSVEPSVLDGRQVPLSNADSQASESTQPALSQSIEPQPTQPQTSTEAEFVAEFDTKISNQKPKKANSIGNYFKRKVSNVDYETLKSELATYIEKNAPSQDAWGYLLNLEQCNDASQLLDLTQNIQSSTSGGLSRGMGDFSKKIKRQL